jgi:hypothetical protein
MKKETKIQIGLRLLFASLVLMLGSKVAPMSAFVLAGMILSLPTFKFKSFHKMILGEGFTSEQEGQLEKLMNKAGEKNKEVIKVELESAVKGFCKVSDLEEKFVAMGLKSETIKELTDAVTKQGDELRKFLEKGTKNEIKHINTLIDDQAANLAKVANGEQRSVKMVIDRKTTVLTTAVSGNTMAVRLPDVGQLPYASMVLRPLFRQSGIGAGMNGTIRYYDQANITRGAVAKAENTAFPESVIDWIERTASAQKIADSIPVTKESLNDIEFVKGEIDRLLNINMALKEDYYLYAGTGNAPEIKGINVYATSKDAVIAAAPYLASVEEANFYDLIANLRVLLSTGKQSKYAMNVVLINPFDTLKYKLKKGADGHYVLPPFISQNGSIIDSVRVVESNQVTQNTLTAGDFRYGTIYDAQGLEIEMGMINDQFVKDAYTIKASQRELLLVRNVDADAFIKIDDVDAAVASLTA